MKKMFKVLITLLIAVILTGCQPTPNTPIVINKGEDTLEQAIAATAAPTLSPQSSSQISAQTTPAAEIWQDSLKPSNAGVKINIDAAIETPLVMAYPVYEVTPHEITLNEANKFVNYFMQGRPIYDVENVQTKSDIAEKIVKVKGQIQETEKDTKTSEEQRQLLMNSLNEELEQYNKDYENAPEGTPQPELATVKFKNFDQSDSESYKAITVYSDLGKTKMASMRISVYDDNLGNSIDYINTDSKTRYFDVSKAIDKVQGLNISRLNAQELAEKTLRDLGITDMQLTSAKIGIDVSGLNSKKDMDNAIKDESKKKCYTFYFGPGINGITETNYEPCYGIQSDDNGNSFDKVWSQEEINISVDDTGVIMFEWNNMGDIGKMLNSNVQLFSLDKIKDIFKKQIFYQRTWTAGYDNNVINITKVQLSYMRIKVKNRGTYMLIPVWDFIGDWNYEITTVDSSGNKNTSAINHADVSFLTVNSIDGSVVNRYQDY